VNATPEPLGADGWKNLLEPIIDRYKDAEEKLYFRAYAAFASPGVYAYLEDEGVLYAIRLKANNNLYCEIEHLLIRPVGRPLKQPRVFYHSFSYRAVSWTRSRRVVAKVEWHQGELFPQGRLHRDESTEKTLERRTLLQRRERWSTIPSICQRIEWLCSGKQGRKRI